MAKPTLEQMANECVEAAGGYEHIARRAHTKRSKAMLDAVADSAVKLHAAATLLRRLSSLTEEDYREVCMVDCAAAFAPKPCACRVRGSFRCDAQRRDTEKRIAALMEVLTK